MLLTFEQLAQCVLLTENIIEMTELETQIWNTVHNWCDAQSNEIPDQNRRYLMGEIKALVLSHASKSLPTDEEISKQAKKYDVENMNDAINRIGGFIVGAKWMRDFIRV